MNKSSLIQAHIHTYIQKTHLKKYILYKIEQKIWLQDNSL